MIAIAANGFGGQHLSYTQISRPHVMYEAVQLLR